MIEPDILGFYPVYIHCNGETLAGMVHETYIDDLHGQTWPMLDKHQHIMYNINGYEYGAGDIELVDWEEFVWYLD